VSIGCVLAGALPDEAAAPPPRVLADDELRALWELAQRGASPDPGRRFATMDDLLVALGRGGVVAPQGV
jgi:hypothetical protein